MSYRTILAVINEYTGSTVAALFSEFDLYDLTLMFVACNELLNPPTIHTINNI